LFHKKGTNKCFPYRTRQVPKSWCTSNGTFQTEGGGNLEVKFFVHWGRLTLDHVNKWQCDLNGYSEADDMINIIWLKELLNSSMDVELWRQVDYVFYLQKALYQQGGISYFKTVVDTVFKMSSMAEESLKSFIKDFGIKGLAKIPNENVRLISF
jgi:hypothetical protein